MFEPMSFSSKAYHLDFNFLAENVLNKNIIADCFYISFDKVYIYID